METSYAQTFDPGIKLIDASERKNAREQRVQPSKPRTQDSLSEPFIVPTPLKWTSAAAKLPGKSLHVGQALWYVSGLRKTRTVKLSKDKLNLFGVSRHAYSNCLSFMEAAGLVKVERRVGKTPLVTILVKNCSCQRPGLLPILSP
jgi:hypothetical protein